MRIFNNKLALITLLPLCRVVEAQPAKLPLSGAALAEQQASALTLQKFAKLRAEKQELERRDAQAAIDEYQKFYEREGYLHPSASLEIASVIARLYYIELHRKEKSLEIYDWALGKFVRVAGWERVYQEREQVRAGKLARLPEAVQIGGVVAPETVPGTTTVKSPSLVGTTLKAVGVSDAPWQKWPMPAPGNTASGIIAPNIIAPGKAPLGAPGGVSVGAFAQIPSVKMPSLAAIAGKLPKAVVTYDAEPSISLPNVALAPIGSVSAVPVGANALYGAVLMQLKSGLMTPEQAWQRAGLTANVALGWINSKNLRWPDHADLSNALIEQVNRHAPTKLERAALKTLPLETRVRIGDYFSAKQDERALDIYHDVMSDGATPGTPPEWYGPAGARLGAFYEAKGELQKALSAYLDVVDKLPKNGGYGGNAALDAARLFNKLGDENGAALLYAKIPAYGSGWLTGLALHDQAQVAMNRRDYEKAELLLQKNVIGAGAERIGVVLQAELAKNYYQTADFKKCREVAGKAITSFDVLPLSQRSELSLYADRTQGYLGWIETWKKTPLLCDREQLHVVLPDGLESEITLRQLEIRSNRPVPLKASVSDSRIRVALAETTGEMDFYVSRLLIVEIAPVAKSFDAEISVYSPAFPEFQLKIPVHVEVPNVIRPSVPSVFFGTVKIGDAVARELNLSAKIPFRVVKVESTDAELAVSAPTENATTQTLRCLLTAKAPNRIFKGTIRVTTNLPAQEVMEVPYFVSTLP